MRCHVTIIGYAAAWQQTPQKHLDRVDFTGYIGGFRAVFRAASTVFQRPQTGQPLVDRGRRGSEYTDDRAAGLHL